MPRFTVFGSPTRGSSTMPTEDVNSLSSPRATTTATEPTVALGGFEGVKLVNYSPRYVPRKLSLATCFSHDGKTSYSVTEEDDGKCYVSVVGPSSFGLYRIPFPPNVEKLLRAEAPTLELLCLEKDDISLDATDALATVRLCLMHGNQAIVICQLKLVAGEGAHMQCQTFVKDDNVTINSVVGSDALVASTEASLSGREGPPNRVAFAKDQEH